MFFWYPLAATGRAVQSLAPSHRINWVAMLINDLSQGNTKSMESKLTG
jgi:hypothetical protein